MPQQDWFGLPCFEFAPKLHNLGAAKTRQQTTLVEQKESNLRASSIAIQGDGAAKKVASSNPEELFGAASSKWASLAFGN